jgi:hypothetical protein
VEWAALVLDMMCLIKDHVIKMYRGVQVQPHAFLTLALDEGEWSHSWPGCFWPVGKSLVPYGQEAVWAPQPVWTLRRNKNICYCRNNAPLHHPLRPQPNHYIDWAILTLLLYSGLLGFSTLSIVQYSKKQKNTTFRKLDPFPSLGEEAGHTYSVRPIRKSSSSVLLFFRIPDDGQSPKTQ